MIALRMRRGRVSRERRLRVALRNERGAGSVLVLALIGAVALATSIVLWQSALLVAQGRADAAADAAALAAASAAAGRISAVPCELAADIAGMHHADVDSCLVEGLVVTVSSSVRVGPQQQSSLAIAGPPR